MEYGKRRVNSSNHISYGGLYYSIISFKIAIILLFLPLNVNAQQTFVCGDFNYIGRHGSTSLFPQDNFFTFNPGYHRIMYVLVDVRQPYSATINTFADFGFDGNIFGKGIGSYEQISQNTYITPVFFVGNSSTTTIRVQSQFTEYDIYVSNCSQSSPTPTPSPPTPAPFPTVPVSGLFACSEEDYQFENFPYSALIIDNIDFVGTIQIKNNTPLTVTVEVELAISNSFETYIIVPPYSVKEGGRIEFSTDSKRLKVVDPISWGNGGIQYRVIPFGGCVNPINPESIIPTPVSSNSLQPNVKQVSFGVTFVSRNCYTIIQNYSFQQSISIPFTSNSWDISFDIPGLEVCVKTYNASLTYDNQDLINIVVYPLVIIATLWAAFQIIRD